MSLHSLLNSEGIVKFLEEEKYLQKYLWFFVVLIAGYHVGRRINNRLAAFISLSNACNGKCGQV